MLAISVPWHIFYIACVCIKLQYRVWSGYEADFDDVLYFAMLIPVCFASFFNLLFAAFTEVPVMFFHASWYVAKNSVML